MSVVWLLLTPALLCEYFLTPPCQTLTDKLFFSFLVPVLPSSAQDQAKQGKVSFIFNTSSNPPDPPPPTENVSIGTGLSRKCYFPALPIVIRLVHDGA